MKADTTASEVIDKLLGQTDFTPPTTLWVSLYTTAPDGTGGGTECAGNGYARVAVPNDSANWPNAVAGTKANALTIQFPTPIGPWGDVIAFGLHTHITDDALYMWGDLEDTFQPDVGSDPKFTPGDLAVEET